MKAISTSVCLLTAAVTGGQALAVSPGVSAELSRSRAESISNLNYDVTFILPENPAEKVTGEVKATFDYSPDGVSHLAFDFKAPEENVIAVCANGADLRVEYQNEHILIPDSLLKKTGNCVDIRFISSESGLNRRDGLVYSLFVPDRARGAFPCFDQPDLKGRFSLTLDMPEQWLAVSNSPQRGETIARDGRKRIFFDRTEPLSTYLFAFAAGNFNRAIYEKDGRTISAYHRESDPKRVMQLDDIFRDVVKSLEWQETHTDIPYPFSKYDLVILPGFQFGGMEHTGATFYNDKSLFLSENPTPAEILNRSSLIAHETSHMWFGDLVTMRWFDDVWTKEVFANYYAATITRELLPEFDHDVEWLRDYTEAALSEDRSEGATEIRQKLDNLNNAGLVYNSIIYNKAPVMLAKLVDLIGWDAYRDGIREYLKTYSYSNADWDELVEAISHHTDEDVKEFSRVWVYEKGLPHFSFELDGESITVRQRDPFGKGNVWPQKFQIALADSADLSDLRVYDVVFKNADSVRIPIKSPVSCDIIVIPNYDGKGYGMFATSPSNTEALLHVFSSAEELAKLPRITSVATIMGLYDNYLAGNISASEWVRFCLDRLQKEDDPQLASTVTGYMSTAVAELSGNDREKAEREIWDMAQTHPVKSCRTSLTRLLINNAESEAVCGNLYNLWKDGTSKVIGEKDYMNLAWQLSLRYPERRDGLIEEERSRLTNPDRLAEFDYVARATASDPEGLDRLFESLKEPANRRIEPWTREMLSLLFHPLREEWGEAHLEEALRMLPDVQRHGDIFYPANWSKAVLKGLKSPEAYAIAKRVIESPEFSDTKLKNKLQNAAVNLYRLNK